ncbi:hypothetical protein AHF37_02051 [Paragonimus kellicotti]|nr:hypothetical protein AHF37_02051 [Paragonimus kellicotti]
MPFFSDQPATPESAFVIAFSLSTFACLMQLVSHDLTSWTRSASILFNTDVCAMHVTRDAFPRLCCHPSALLASPDDRFVGVPRVSCQLALESK